MENNIEKINVYYFFPKLEQVEKYCNVNEKCKKNV